MKLLDKMAAEDLSHNIGECLQRLGEIEPELSLGEKLMVSLWWSRKLPRVFRPVVAVIVDRKSKK